MQVAEELKVARLHNHVEKENPGKEIRANTRMAEIELFTSIPAENKAIIAGVILANFGGHQR